MSEDNYPICCTCKKDPRICCIVHPHSLAKDVVLIYDQQAEIERLKADKEDNHARAEAIICAREDQIARQQAEIDRLMVIFRAASSYLNMADDTPHENHFDPMGL